MAVAWASFFPYVQPYVPGCPEIVIEAHLQEAARLFCARSQVWRFDIEADFTSRNLSDYDIAVPAGAALDNILALYLEGSPLARTTDAYASVSASADPSRPTAYSIYRDTQVRFYPTPDGKYTFDGVGVLKPSLTATGVEDFIFASHGRSIASGAVYLLAEIPGKEWSNPEMSAYHRARFYRDADDAQGDDLRRANMRVRPVGFEKATSRRRW